MGWKVIHRWIGLAAGCFALVAGVTGVLLAIDPVVQARHATQTPADLSVATLAERVQRAMPGVEEIRRLPSGALVAYGFDGERAQASYVDPGDGRALSAYRPSQLPRWVKNLHRSWLLDDPGRWGAAGIALAMALISCTGLVLLLRRMGGWHRLAGQVRGSLAQRVHVLAGRVALVVLLLSSLTALFMSATTLGLLELDPGLEPDVVSVAGSQAGLSGARLPILQSLKVQDLRKLNFPSASDTEDVWKVTTGNGQGWIDRYSGQTLAWQDFTPTQRLYDWAVVLHTGESAWPWAIVLGLAGASIVLLWVSGLLIWWRARRQAVHITGNSVLSQADTLVFVASEDGSTWGFAQTLHDALVQGGHRVHTSGLENFLATPVTRRVFVLAATYGDGQAPTHARQALERIAQIPPGVAPVAVVGFGDRQFPTFCAFAQALEQALRTRGWPTLLPLECIHQQSSQQFALWGESVAQVLKEPLVLSHVPRAPSSTTLTLVSRQDYPGQTDRPTAILRFRWPQVGWRDRLRGRGLAHFAAGDLVGIIPSGTGVPRYYSLASGTKDGFLEICVRLFPGGLCSTQLHGLKPGDTIQAYIRRNPGFALQGRRSAVVLIGAGTGVAPLAGFIRRNDERIPMHLYYGGRDPALDFYFAPEIRRWLGEQRLASLQTEFSRIPGGGYVQDALRRDAARLQDLLQRGAIVRVCGSHPMGRDVARTLDDILGALRLSVQELKAKGRYAEDLF
ncbi:MAG: PepSY domain-containing protein [Gammaproteobacteria bacterium]|nr:PepSY domain-containing protein [Gammaproteobacteria bacterium]